MPFSSVILTVTFLSAIAVFYFISPAKARPERDAFANVMFAHRGLFTQNGDIPENSLPAFEAARVQGCGVELDVRLTRDCVPIVFHDADLLRMCGIDKKICDMDYAELADICLLQTREHIPTLSQAINTLGYVPIICDIKPQNVYDVEEICRQTLAVMDSYRGEWCIESFSPIAVRWFAKNAPDVVRGQITMRKKEFTLHNFLAQNLCFNFLSRPDFIACEQNLTALGLFLVRFMRPLMIAWTVRSEKELETVQKKYDSYIFEGFN